MSTSAPVILFGPTGAAGSYAALAAYEHYSSSSNSSDKDVSPRIILAMRDPSKPISRLPESPLFHRVRADLTDPASVTTAVESTGAKRAFVYLVHNDKEYLRPSLTAMKKAGVEFVVFLSSFTIQTKDVEEMKKIPHEEIIPYLHAQVEINLHDVYGAENFVPVRPGTFASNYAFMKDGIKKGVVDVYKPEMPIDQITSRDMGTVAGRILVGVAPKPPAGGNAVYLYGPKMVTHREAIGILSKALDKKIEIKEQNEEELMKSSHSELFAKYVIKQYTEALKGNTSRWSYLEEGKENVQKFGGRPALQFEDWANEQENKDLFK